MLQPTVPFPVSVIGAGSWGTALAVLACSHCDTLLWARSADVAGLINQSHANPRYLPGIPLPKSLVATTDLAKATDHVLPDGSAPGLIILGVPVAGLRDTCHQLAKELATREHTGLSILWTCKGFDETTGELPHQIVDAAFAHLNGIQTGVLSGPSFAREVATGQPVALTVAAPDPQTIDKTIQALHSPQARIYSSSDIIGVEVGGALKNVLAIACGISDGLGLGTNARAALITRGLAEIQRLGVALGGRPETFIGLTGLGDLVLTTTGDLSRNRRVGLALGQGQSLSGILASGMTAEGVRCAQAALKLGQERRIELPITEAVCQVLFQSMAPADAVQSLLNRQARPESDF